MKAPSGFSSHAIAWQMLLAPRGEPLSSTFWLGKQDRTATPVASRRCRDCAEKRDAATTVQPKERLSDLFRRTPRAKQICHLSGHHEEASIRARIVAWFLPTREESLLFGRRLNAAYAKRCARGLLMSIGSPSRADLVQGSRQSGSVVYAGTTLKGKPRSFKHIYYITC